MTRLPPLPASAPAARFAVRVYYEDTDFSGRVYHAAYLRFAERARSEYLRALGLTHPALLAEKPPLGFVVKRMEIAFIAAARIDDELEVRTWPSAASPARLHLLQAIFCREEEIWRAQIEIACVALDKNRPTKLPATLRRILSNPSQP